MDVLRTLKPVRILLVEDSPSDARLIREALGSSQLLLHITHVKDGVEAIEQLSRLQQEGGLLPDLILLDLNLPRKTGSEVLKEIKADQQLKKIPVLVMTSSNDERDIRQAYCLNANCYICKPLELMEYERVVRAIESFWCTTVLLPETLPVPPLGSERGNRNVFHPAVH
jgi:two-component system, chemotaxis family, response regulator Rcp1